MGLLWNIVKMYKIHVI